MVAEEEEWVSPVVLVLVEEQVEMVTNGTPLTVQAEVPVPVI
jgi:hypothetical protein